MAVIDAHLHFWNPAEVEYPWLTPELDRLNRAFEPAELEPQLRVAGVDRAVLVQTADSYEDTAVTLRTADLYDWIAAVVGWVDLTVPEEAERRAGMYRQHPKFRGVTHHIHAESNPDWILHPLVLESLRIIARNDLVYEVSAVFPMHLRHLPEVARQVPDLKLVVTHLAKPPVKGRQLSPWLEQMEDAAAFPNVYAKISGLNTAADWETWSAADIKPFIDAAIDLFGPDRLMYGSDWPVCLLAGSYQAVWVETNRALEGRSAREIDAIMGGTAERVYRL